MAEILISLLFITTIFKKDFIFFRKSDKVLVYILIAVFILTFVHVIFSPTALVLFGNKTRAQGTILLSFLLLFSYLSSKVELPDFKYKLYPLILVVIFILSFLIGNQTGRAVATIGEPNALAAFVIFLWPFIFFSKFESKKKEFMIRSVCLLLALTIILLSGSRSGLLAFGIEILFYFLASVIKLPLKKIIIFALFLIVIAYALPFLDKSLYENRVDVWSNAFISGMANPIIGVGFGNAEIAMRNTSLKFHDMLIGYYVDSAHNIFLDWWIQGGIVGIILLFMIILKTVKNLYKKHKKFELIIFSGIIVMLSFNPGSVVTLLGFWWLVGQSFGEFNTK